VLGNYQYGYLTGRVEAVDAPPQNNGTASCTSQLRYQFDGTLMTEVTASGCPGAGKIEWQHTGFYEPKTLKITAGTTPTLNTVLLRDRDSLLTGVDALVLSRNPLNGLLSSTTLGQVSDSYSYNSFAESENYSVNTPLGSVFTQGFLRDKLGRIRQKTETVNAITTTFDYGYDPAGRLETVRENKVLVATYGFDGNSNRTSRTAVSGTSAGTYDAQDRMTSYGGCTYLYTANGEMARKTCGSAITQFDIDVMGNLRSVTLPDSTQIRYLIDGANRRIGKLRNNVLEKSWLWQSQLRPAAQLDIAGNAQQFYLYGEKLNVPSYLVSRENGVNVTYRVISDHLGSVRLVVNADTGVVAQRLRYDEFGVVLEDTNPGFQPFGYAGGFYDADTDLVRFGARDYDSAVGRWLAKDPMGFSSGQINFYCYVKSDPVNLIDLSGTVEVATGPQVESAGNALKRAAGSKPNSIALKDAMPILSPEVLDQFDKKRGPLQCDYGSDGSIDFANSGDKLRVDYTEEYTDNSKEDHYVEFADDISARVRFKDGKIIIDRIKGIKSSHGKASEIRIEGARACVPILWTC